MPGHAGQADPIATVGSWSFVLARPGLEEDSAYRVVRALARTELTEAQPRNLVGLVPADAVNPGTARVLREAGVTLR
ncbi:hypothetical protein [Methylobacterium mesophilicum]|uniref:hypothetical protein n=1 Tax=Methylobacterium mesophilicum TaxID=39956 RepID=UPI002F3560E0